MLYSIIDQAKRPFKQGAAMFTHLSDLTKSAWFYMITFGLVLAITLMSGQRGIDPSWGLMFTPLAAVLLMFFVVTRDGTSKKAWLSLGLHRAGFRSWGLALLAPVAVLALAYGLAWTLGIGRFTWPGPNPITNFPASSIVIGISLSLLLAFGEEIGWRGYLLPHLLPLGRTRALLVSGLLHGLFHLPLMLFTPFYHGLGSRLIVIPLFLLALTAAGVWYGYLRLTSHSVWPAAIAHTSLNIFVEQFTNVTIAASPLALEYLVGESGVFTLVGIIVAAGWFIYRMNKQSPAPIVTATD
jgi:membrane protease YdiL (CAAX protease family)